MSFILWLLVLAFTGAFLGPSVCSSALLIYVTTKLYRSVFVQRNWIHPGFFYSVFVFLATASNLQIISLFESGVFLRSYRYARPELFGEAAMIWALGNFLIIEGFGISPPFQIPKLVWNLRGKKPLSFLFWFSIALIFRKYWMSFSLPGALNNIFPLIPLLGILMHARLAELRSDRKLFIRGLILTGLATGYSVLFAYLRMEMVLPGLVFFLGTLAGARGFAVLRAPRFYPLYIFMGLFVVFFAALGQLRSSGIAFGTGRLAQLRKIESIAEETGDYKGNSLLNRASTIGQLSALAGLVKDKGFYKGRVSEILLVAFVPRFLWPTKPVIALGAWFAFEIGFAYLWEGGWYNNSINMTIPGHLFLDFGWIGLLLGCFLVGRFLRLLWDTTNFTRQPLNFTGSLFAAYLLYTCFLGFGADLQILVTFIAVYLIILVLDRIFYIHAPQQVHHPKSPAQPVQE